jgi:hypothetical protein
MDPYRVFLTQISKKLTKIQWHNCANKFPIPEAERESFTTAFDFFWWLHKSQKISPENLQFLKEIFISEQREDLAKLVDVFQGNITSFKFQITIDDATKNYFFVV